LQTTIECSFPEGEQRTETSQEDRQGLGIPTQRHSGIP
jgi:hypothetical protein